MKLILDKEKDKAVLTVPTTMGGTKRIKFPKKNLYYWYPFNLNFSYKYTNAKEFIYLVREDRDCKYNYYQAGRLKKSEPLKNKDGYPLHPSVYKRNKYIIERAKKLGIPTIDKPFDKTNIEIGFKRLAKLIKIVKTNIENRAIERDDEALYALAYPNEEWDELVYKYATEQEEQILIEFGEMYTMLNLMRKLLKKG